MSFKGYTKEQLEWKNSLNNERNEAFASMCCEMSNDYEITPQEVLNLVTKHFWETWDTSNHVRYLVKENYPIR